MEEKLMPQHLNLHVKSLLNGCLDDNTNESKMPWKFARFFSLPFSHSDSDDSLHTAKAVDQKKIQYFTYKF